MVMMMMTTTANSDEHSNGNRARCTLFQHECQAVSETTQPDAFAHDTDPHGKADGNSGNPLN